MGDKYPKAITVDGLPITAQDAADEARWTAGKQLVDGEAAAFESPKLESAHEPDPEPADALADLELDGAALNDGHEPEPVPSSPRKSRTFNKKK